MMGKLGPAQIFQKVYILQVAFSRNVFPLTLSSVSIASELMQHRASNTARCCKRAVKRSNISNATCVEQNFASFGRYIRIESSGFLIVRISG